MAETYEIFRRLAEHPTLALYGTTSISGNIKASGYQLTTRVGQLVIRSLIRPQDIAAPDEVVRVEPRQRLLQMAEAIMESFAEPLDLTVFTDERKAKLEEILTAKGGIEVVEKVQKPVEADALLAALERSLEATTKKKAA